MAIQFLEDREISGLIMRELQRQEGTISLIASENYAPVNVLQAAGSVLSNKYAEGLPGKRYYAGCAEVDAIETIAIERCKNLFKAEHVNVQPHAGSQANMAVYMASLKPGDTLMGMDLASGGHLTHGFGGNFSGQLYKIVSYGVDPVNECIDYDLLASMVMEHRPSLIVAGASAYSRTIDFKKFSDIAQSVGALLMADIAHIAGLVAAGVHPSPVPYADFVTSTTHKTLCGPRGAFVMCRQEHAKALDRTIMPGIQGGPFMNSIAAKAVCFGNALRSDFIDYQRQIIANARTIASTLAECGYRIVSGGTDNHMCIVDLTAQGCTGKQVELLLESVGITCSRSCIPFDTQKPMVGSGIRLGASAITTRGATEVQAQDIALMVHEVIMSRDDQRKLHVIRKKIRQFCEDFPIYSK